MKERMEEVIRVRAPAHLVQALEAEAKRRTISKSSLIRLTLARELGLFDEPDRHYREKGAGE